MSGFENPQGSAAKPRGFTPHPECPTCKGGDEWAFGRDSAPRRKPENKGATAVKPRGFTMLEMVIATCMVALLGFALYAVFSNGMKIFNRVSQPLAQEDVQIFLTHFTSDVRNALPYSKLSFVGTGEHVELVTLVQGQRLGALSVGKVIYSFDAESGVLSRQQLDMSQLYTQEPVEPSAAIGGIDNFHLYYYAFDPVKQTCLWLDQWNNQELPLAIRLEFILTHDNVSTTVTKTVTIPRSA
jgi:type II secretory pathway pseudopilin PulG